MILSDAKIFSKGNFVARSLMILVCFLVVDLSQAAFVLENHNAPKYCETLDNYLMSLDNQFHWKDY